MTGTNLGPSPINNVETGIPQWQLNVDADMLKTEIAAFLIQGKRQSDQIYVPDMDILVTKDNKRLIPLLRFLRLIEATGELSNDMVIFKVEGGKRTPIDLLNKTLQVGNNKIPLDIQVGISDMTNMAEIYVSEEVLKQALGFDFTWDPEKVAYIITTDKELEIFKRRRLKITPVSSAEIMRMSEYLPETEPPARPKAQKPFVSFFQTDSRAGIIRQSANNVASNLISAVPSLNAWGSLFSGDYTARLRRSLSYPEMGSPNIPASLASCIDQVKWTLKKDSLVVNAGDTNIGLSDLVGPAVNLVGATFKWLPDAGNKKELKDRFFKMSRPNFKENDNFEGYAPLESEVSLYVNNRLIDTRKIEDFDGAPVGYGHYRFENVGLWNDSINEIKIVTKRQDGFIEEDRREILSVDRLLPAGQFALLGGLGTRKYDLSGETAFEGNFSGIQSFYGLSKDLTLGFTAATQDKYSFLNDDLTGEYHSSPRRHYVAQEARYRIFNHLFSKYNVAVSYDPFSNKQAFASKAEMEYYLKQAKLNAQLFSYDPDYSNGVTSISDRRGYSLYGNWQVCDKLFLKGTLLHIFNNIDGALDTTDRDDAMTLGATISGVIPRSTLELQAARLDRLGGGFDAVKGNMYGAELQSTITDKLDFSLYCSFGDRINGFSTNDLSYGLPLPNLNSFYSYNDKLRVNYRVSPTLSVSSSYYRSTYSQDRAEASISYNSNGKRHWRSRLDLGAALDTKQCYLKNNLEFDLDKNGDNRIGIRTGFNGIGGGYDIGFYVTMKNMFAMKDGRIDNLAGIRMYPERGGIEGTVYLDLNCNGHRDLGEPGLPAIAILLDDKKCTESDEHGDFYILKKDDKNFVSVSLDINSLDAIYTPTQGMQKAYLEEAAFTTVNLGVCVTGAVSGTLKVMDRGDFKQNLSGARITLRKIGQGAILKDSITAYDGSFYIGQITPGDYVLRVDMEALKDTYEITYGSIQKIHFSPSDKPVEIEDCDLFLKLREVEVVAYKETAMAVEEEKKTVEAKKIAVNKNPYVLSEEEIAAEHKIIWDRALKALQYFYTQFTLPKYIINKNENAINVVL